MLVKFHDQKEFTEETRKTASNILNTKLHEIFPDKLEALIQFEIKNPDAADIAGILRSARHFARFHKQKILQNHVLQGEDGVMALVLEVE